MYRGLLARPGSLGNNLITKQRYVRSYQERETYMGKEVGGRASWFLYGRRATGLGGPQPARPAWPRLWREQQARLAVFRHFNRAGRLMRGEA